MRQPLLIRAVQTPTVANFFVFAAFLFCFQWACLPSSEQHPQSSPQFQAPSAKSAWTHLKGQTIEQHSTIECLYQFESGQEGHLQQCIHTNKQLNIKTIVVY